MSTSLVPGLDATCCFRLFYQKEIVSRDLTCWQLCVEAVCKLKRGLHVLCSAMYVPKRNVKDQGEGLRLASAEEGSPGRMKEGKDSCSVYTVETEYDLAHCSIERCRPPFSRESI